MYRAGAALDLVIATAGIIECDVFVFPPPPPPHLFPPARLRVEGRASSIPELGKTHGKAAQALVMWASRPSTPHNQPHNPFL